MGDDLVQRPGDAVEIEGLDQQARVADLAAAAASHEPPQLLPGGAVAPRRHLLEHPEPAEVAVGGEDVLDTCHAEGPDQLVLEVLDADEEPELLQVDAGEAGAETRALERPAEHRLLAGVAEAREAGTFAALPELVEEPSDAVRAAERDDAAAGRRDVDPASLGEGLDRVPVAQALDDHRHAGAGLIEPRIQRHHRTRPRQGSVSSACRPWPTRRRRRPPARRPR